jgi:ribosome biogenesis protein ENP2
VKVLPLTSDGEKLCILRNDRIVEFHAKYGYHESIHIPEFCYDICINPFRAEVLMTGDGNNVYRFNLEQGRFLKSYNTRIQEIRSVEFNTTNGLIGIGGDRRIEFLDQRCKKIVRSVEYSECPSTIGFSEGGLEVGVGMIEGTTYFHDLRARKEMIKIDDNTRIRRILFNGKTMIGQSGLYLRCYNRNGVLGEYRALSKMSCFECSGGMIYIGFENGEMKSFGVKELGEMPRWYKAFDDQ